MRHHREPEPDTYSLTGSGPNGELFLVTCGRCGRNIGHAEKIGGPVLVAPIASRDGEVAATLDVERLARACDNLYRDIPVDFALIAAEYERLSRG